MVEDPWARPAEGADPLPEPATGGRGGQRWVLPALLVLLVVMLLAGGWLVAAKRGVDEFRSASGDDPTPTCDDDLTIESVRPQVPSPQGVPDGLDRVVRAFDAYFAQERWSFTDASEDLTGARSDHQMTLSVDGDVLERREPDGFVGLIRPGSGVARFEGDRFWVPACVNGNRGWAPFTNADCVESERKGASVVVRWSSHREGTCDDAVIHWSATLEDGALVGWSIEGEGRFRSTVTTDRGLCRGPRASGSPRPGSPGS